VNDYAALVSLLVEIESRAYGVELDRLLQIASGIHTTGEMGRGILEQSLVIVAEQGLVVITGCAHPGVVDIIAKAKEITGREVCLVVGGFHLAGMDEAAIQEIVRDFRELGVRRVAPCHCSGDLACRLFR